jgi:ankyrin repeat protein
MPARDLPARPNLEQYKKQAKELLDAYKSGDEDAIRRVREYVRGVDASGPQTTRIALADAQFVLARDHGFDSWPTFAKHIETLTIARDIDALTDPAAAFFAAATPPREAHSSGTLERAEAIRERYPDVARGSIYAAALIADEASVRNFLSRDPALATAKGGPYGWDALTYLCFSRYLRLDATRSEAFVRTARALLDAGASANTGWYETIDTPPRQIIESAIYGAAGIAQHVGVTRLLLERGADPNDEETPYHVAETRNNDVLRVLLDSGRLNDDSFATLLLRKADWHDLEGMRLLLEHGVDPNRMTPWSHSALHQAVKRDNSMQMIELLVEHGANPSLPNTHDGRSATAMAAHRGRRAALVLFLQRGASPLNGVDALIAACALDDRETMQSLISADPALRTQLMQQGGTLLAQFSGTNNVDGVRNLIESGISPAALYREGDGYYGIATDSTALHVAAWRACHDVVKELIARGTPVNALDGRGRTALQLAIKAGLESFWVERRSPVSVKALIGAGASLDGVEIPTGYDEVDALLRERLAQQGGAKRAQRDEC